MVLVPLLVVCWLFGATAGVCISDYGFNRTSIFPSKKSKKIVVTTDDILEVDPSVFHNGVLHS